MPGLVLSLLGVGRAVMSWLSKRSLAELACIALALFAVVQTLRVSSEHRQNVKLKAQVVKCSEARKADQDAYRKDQSEAAAQNKAQVAAIEAQQKRISDERLKDANDRLARLADELRKHGPAAQSSPGNPGLPQVPSDPAGTPGETRLCLSPDQLLRAAQDEERHDQLITLIEQLMKADPNKN